MGSLTDEQINLIRGLLLGDGSLRRKTNTLLEINHSYKQKAYVDWIYERLEEFVSTPPKIRTSGINRKSYRFTTLSLPDLNVFYDDFYPINKVKTVPRNLTLNALTLSVWFMDDGSRSRNSIYLNTQQFSQDDQELLQSLLFNIGLKSTLNRDKKYYRIRLRTESISLFKRMVSSYIISSMKYKLP